MNSEFSFILFLRIIQHHFLIHAALLKLLHVNRQMNRQIWQIFTTPFQICQQDNDSACFICEASGRRIQQLVPRCHGMSMVHLLHTLHELCTNQLLVYETRGQCFKY